MTWLVEGLLIILASFIIGVVVAKAMKSVNGED